MRPAISILTLSACATITACGGGGGGGGGGLALLSPAAAPAPSADPAAPAPSAAAPALASAGTDTLQRSAAAGPYADASPERAAFNRLQQVRGDCGFGLLNPNARLDQASRAHVNYLIAASSATLSVTGHGEPDTNNPYFTGGSPADRAAAAGYGASVEEGLDAWTQSRSGPLASAASLPANDPSAWGRASMDSLINSVYHLSTAVSGAIDVGMGSAYKRFDQSDSTTYRYTDLFRFGYLAGSQTGTQKLGAGNVATYPCAASTDVAYAFAPANESPNPFPEINSASVLVGPPVYLRTDLGNILSVSSYGLKDAAGAAVSVRTDTPGIGNHEFFMVPRSPLTPDSRYTASFVGTANGKAFTVNFTFKTRS